MEVFVFIGLAVALVLGLIGFFGRCRACGSWGHAFNPGHAADIPDGKAYIVCKRCGDRQHKGEVSSDGSVVWMSGGSGQFHEDGSYTGDSGSFADGGANDNGERGQYTRLSGVSRAVDTAAAERQFRAYVHFPW